ncbi:MAG: zinc/manganese transport system substrate-binding protein, partial [Acidimicrobiaceae bacterium]|nr:zinc/manganese transport system substrate-binding protein [Acidimicrobiaceae bacterium]
MCRSAAALTCVGVLSAACSSSSRNSATPAPTKTLRIVAGENFWGSIVSQLAGRTGTVTSVMSNPGADPHNYESSSS